MGSTTISCYNDSYTFTTQSSSTFTFLAGTISYNPNDILPAIPPVRGTRKQTIGGSNINQFFLQCNSDAVIAFTAWLSYAEIQDFIAAKAKLAQWQLKDYLGGNYVVTFDCQAGFACNSKIQANDKFICQFKFNVESIS